MTSRVLPARVITRVVIRICLCVLAGVLLPQLSSFPPRSDLLLGALVLLIFCLPQLRRADLLLILLGTSVFMLDSAGLAADRLAARFEGDSILTTLRVLEFPRQRPGSVRFVATAVDDPRLPARFQLTWYEAPVRLHSGDLWRMEVRLKRPRGSSNPGSPDRERSLFRDRIGATGYVVSGPRNTLLDSGTATGIDRLRLRLVKRIERAVENADVAAVVMAITVGARHRLSAEQWQRYTATGTSHLMAISGLHIGLAALASYAAASLLLGVLGCRQNLHTLALLLALGVAVSYAIVSGFAVPARRAALMLLLATLTLLKRREVESFRVLAVVTLVACLADPVSTVSAGFRLSFAAVAVLLWQARELGAAGAGGRLRLAAGIGRLASVQLMLFVTLMPLTVLIFSRVSITAPLVNLVAVPVFSFVTVPAALAGLLLDGPFAAAGDLSLVAAGQSVRWLERLIAWSAAFDVVPIAAIEGRAWWLLAALLTWWVLPAGFPGRPVAWLAVPALMLWEPGRPPAGCARIDVLDVGQGLAVVVQTRNHALLYDSGPAWRNGGSAADSVVLPFLRSRGVRSLDAFFVSHPDSDHAGGAAAVLDSLPVNSLVVGQPLPSVSRLQRRCASNQSWHWDGVEFRVLYPQPGDEVSGNDASCVLQVATGERRLLLTGDIESKAEARLVRERRLAPVDVVTVPHHGSRTSSGTPFVRALQPRVAVVSAAYRNRWDLPKADVVARWQAAGATVVNTAQSGAIRIDLCAGSDPLRLQQYRIRYQRAWHDPDRSFLPAQ